VPIDLRIQVNSMMEIQFSEQSGAVRNAYSGGAFLVLQMGASLPDVCVVCGYPAGGNVVHKRFGPPDLWWVLPPLTDFIYLVLQSALGTRYTFDFPFCRSCIPRLVQFTPIRPIRLDEDLAVFRGASQSLLNLLSPMPPDVAAERSRGWLERKFKWLLDNV
jgi:hypothetical protein